jgi:excisionase family DNA binding protein
MVGIWLLFSAVVKLRRSTIPEGRLNFVFEPLLDARQSAELLRIHPKTLERMARDKQVPAIKLGRLWRFRASELNEWIAANISKPKLQK